MRRLEVGLYSFKIWHATLLVSLFLLGCCCDRTRYVPAEISPVKLPRKVAGTSDALVMKLQKKLASHGIRVVTIGENYLISIPAAILFPDQSPHLTWRSYALLNCVVRFLKQFRKVAVTITGYSSRYVSAKREHALTLTRSRVVADYLWSQGIDSRFIFMEGVGSDKPLISFRGGGDKSPNSRIEITFRDAVA